MFRKKILFEVCANSIQSALNAQLAQADRIELCENLEVGGTTPNIALIRQTKQQLHIPIHILIRPRAGNFFYSEEEFTTMIQQIESCKYLNVDGIIMGLLNDDLTLDKIRCAELIQLARPLSVTFHRAFDIVSDPFQTLEELINLGADRILTSGQKEDILEGSELINQLVKHAGDNLSILAGGGITEANIVELAEKCGAHEFHFSAKVQSADGSYVSDPDRIRKIRNLANSSFHSIDN
ncbi:MAG: copper homeostasis protein CutC [Chitinophagales bacterium]